MIYIFCALACEAEPIINKYGLKKDPTEEKYGLYRSEKGEIALFILRGTGPVKAAAGISYLAAKYVSKDGPEGGDILLNIGCAAGSIKRYKGIYLCHSIYDPLSDRIFYPDNLCRFDIQSTYLTSLSSVADNVDIHTPFTEMGEECLFDMEAAAVFQAGAPFFGTDKMYFLKVVSDDGVKDTAPSPDRISGLIKEYLGDIGNVIDSLRSYDPGTQSRETEQYIRELSEALSGELMASETMKHQIRQLCRYAVLSQYDIDGYLYGLREEKSLPVKSRREGKILLERITNDWLL